MQAVKYHPSLDKGSKNIFCLFNLPSASQKSGTKCLNSLLGSELADSCEKVRVLLFS